MISTDDECWLLAFHQLNFCDRIYFYFCLLTMYEQTRQVVRNMTVQDESVYWTWLYKMSLSTERDCTRWVCLLNMTVQDESVYWTWLYKMSLSTERDCTRRVCLLNVTVQDESARMYDPVHCFCGWSPPPYVILVSTWRHSRDGWDKAFPVFRTLPLPCIILEAYRRTKNGGGLGTRLVQM